MALPYDKNLVSSLPGLVGGGIKIVYRLRHGLQQHKRRWRRSSSNEAAVFANQPIRYLVSQSLFLTPQKRLYIISYGHGTAGYTRHGHSGWLFVSGANLQNLALVLDRLRVRWCAVWTRCLQPINNNIPLTTIPWPRKRVFPWKRLLEELPVARLALRSLPPLWRTAQSTSKRSQTRFKTG